MTEPPTGPQLVLDAERDAAPLTLELADVRRLDIKPGEILVATLPADTTTATARLIQETVKTLLPDGVKLLLVSADLDLMVLNPEALTDAVLDAPTT